MSLYWGSLSHSLIGSGGLGILFSLPGRMRDSSICMLTRNIPPPKQLFFGPVRKSLGKRRVKDSAGGRGRGGGGGLKKVFFAVNTGSRGGFFGLEKEELFLGGGLKSWWKLSWPHAERKKKGFAEQKKSILVSGRNRKRGRSFVENPTNLFRIILHLVRPDQYFF